MIDLSPTAVTARLRRAADHSDLRSELRLLPKLDMTSSGITRRLESVESLRRFCLELVRIGARNRAETTRRDTAPPKNQ
jgi:hypothetical protein